jgi:hypothetical protein
MSGTVIAALMREGGSGFFIRHRDADQFASGCLKLPDLLDRSRHILVSVEHIDWTETGASPPIFTLPT